MIKSFKVLLPFLVEFKKEEVLEEKIVFLNFEEGKSYLPSGEVLSEDLNHLILEKFFQEQKKTFPIIPEELIEVMNTEKDLTKDSAKHIFRRN